MNIAGAFDTLLHRRLLHNSHKRNSKKNNQINQFFYMTKQRDYQSIRKLKFYLQ